MKTKFEASVSLSCETTDDLDPDEIEKWLKKVINEMELKGTVLDKDVLIKIKKVINIEKFSKSTRT